MAPCFEFGTGCAEHVGAHHFGEGHLLHPGNAGRHPQQSTKNKNIKTGGLLGGYEMNHGKYSGIWPTYWMTYENFNFMTNLLDLLSRWLFVVFQLGKPLLYVDHFEHGTETYHFKMSFRIWPSLFVKDPLFFLCQANFRVLTIQCLG